MIRFLEWLLAKLRGERTYIILRQIYPAPIDIGTAWCAYEAAPQTAKSPAGAVNQFVLDSGLDGIFISVLQDEWNSIHRAPLQVFRDTQAHGYLEDIQ
jgi:hypothetical protein